MNYQGAVPVTTNKDTRRVLFSGTYDLPIHFNKSFIVVVDQSYNSPACLTRSQSLFREKKTLHSELQIRHICACSCSLTVSSTSASLSGPQPVLISLNLLTPSNYHRGLTLVLLSHNAQPSSDDPATSTKDVQHSTSSSSPTTL